MRHRTQLLIFTFACLCALTPASAQIAPVIGLLNATDSGACTTANACLTLNINPLQIGGVGVQITGIGGSPTFQFEASGDGSSFSSIQGFPLDGTASTTSATAAGQWQFTATGLVKFRVRCSSCSSASGIVSLQPSSNAPRGGGGGGAGTAGLTYNTTPPVLTNGATVSAQADVNGNEKVVLYDGNGASVAARVDITGALTTRNQPTGNLLPPCNPLRKTNCQTTGGGTNGTPSAGLATNANIFDSVGRNLTGDGAGNLYVNIAAGLPVDAPDNSAVTTNPVPQGCVYQSNPTALTNGYTGYVTCDPKKNVHVNPWPGTFQQGVVTTAMTGTTSTQVIAGTASNYLYITSCHFSNDHASTDTLELLQDGSGGTSLTKVMNPHGFGNNVIFPTPLKIPTVGNGLYVANVTTSSSTYVDCEGFISTVSY